MKLWRSAFEGFELALRYGIDGKARVGRADPRRGDVDLTSPGAEPLRFPTLAAGRALLDRIATNPLHMAELRALAAARPDAAVVAHRSDAEILDDLASLLKQGSLRAELSRSALSPPKGPEQKEEQRGDVARDQGVNEVEFEITDTFGDPISDVAYVLFFPDGSKKEGKLASDGRVKETGVPPGTYRLELKTLTNARFGASKVLVGEPIKLFATASGFADGASGTFEVYDYRGLAGDKIATVDGSVGSKGALEGEWSPKADDVKDLVGGKVLFIAKIGDAAATSARVPILVKHEIEVEDDKGPIANTKLIVRFMSGYETAAPVKDGKAAVWVRAGDRLAWINLPDHPGAFMKVEEEDGTARELYLPEAVNG